MARREDDAHIHLADVERVAIGEQIVPFREPSAFRESEVVDFLPGFWTSTIRLPMPVFVPSLLQMRRRS